MPIDWTRVQRDAPDLAAAVEARFAASTHHVLGTLDAEGAPRLSGLEVPIRDGHLWLGMMPGSVKRRDLTRDPRFAVHSAPVDATMADGDAKVAGVAVDVSEDQPLVATFLSGSAFDPDEAPGGGMALFIADVRRVTLTELAGDALRVTTWTPAGGSAVHMVR